ncbi:MAG: 3-isopropylmalate dehydratase [Deltaproteobacteria bacterium]|jgi:aconitate hydratase|nr:3-isopropylmalate dehydratase [Deltaproteobacteria bacterium]
MPQKILAGRASDPQLKGDLVQVKVDQVILSRAPSRALSHAIAIGMKKAIPEVSIAYDGTAVTTPETQTAAAAGASNAVSPSFPAHGILVARPGIGFPAPVHIERFAAPGRLALTDDPRLAPVGGVGMLCLAVSPAQLGMAMATGSVWLRPPRSIQIHLSGRTRPFVCARDIALELLRRDVTETVRRIEEQFHAPVVLEFAGPSARMLSVGKRAVLCGIAHQVGAAAALFISDDKAEVFLRDQRRSKAHRALVPDPGAPCEEVLTIDLATVDPLILDEEGTVRTARELADRPVSQVVLGGDSGVTLRDMLAAASLLKSKRIPPRLDLLLAPPSRQVLEVLGQSGALVDLVATGARVVEPDRRIMTGELYPPHEHGASLRNIDPEPATSPGRRHLVASAETLSYAVAHGVVGDPRAFKRPARVTVPRVLPTEDVLVVRAKKEKKAPAQPLQPPPKPAPAVPWKGATSLDLHLGLPGPNSAPEPRKAQGGAKPRGMAVVLSGPEQVRAVADLVAVGSTIRTVIAEHLPSQIVSSLASEGVASFECEPSSLGSLKNQKRINLPKTASWGPSTTVTIGKAKLSLKWLAADRERDWTIAGRAPVERDC